MVAQILRARALSPKTYLPYWEIDCSSSKTIDAYQCYFCNKQYAGKTSSSLHKRANGHQFAIKINHLRSSLFTHLQVHADDSSLPGYIRPSLGDYILIQVEPTGLDKTNVRKIY